jgi:hypothetical protein
VNRHSRPSLDLTAPDRYLDLDPVPAATTRPEGAQAVSPSQAAIVKASRTTAVGAAHQSASGEARVDGVVMGYVARVGELLEEGPGAVACAGRSCRPRDRRHRFLWGRALVVASASPRSSVFRPLERRAPETVSRVPSGIRKDARSEATSALDTVGRGARSKVRADDRVPMPSQASGP